MLHLGACVCVQALQWIAARSATQVMAEREAVISSLEFADQLMRESGACGAWFQNSDEQVRAVAGNANGLLLEQLLAASDYCDSQCVELLRTGTSVPCVGLHVFSVPLRSRS